MQKTFAYFFYFLGCIFPLKAKEPPNQKPPFHQSSIFQSIRLKEGDFVEAECDLPDTYERAIPLKRAFYPVERSLGKFAEGWHFNLRELGEKEQIRRRFIGNPQYLYHTQFDENGRLSRIEAIHPITKRVDEWLTVEYQQFSCTLTSHDGSHVTLGLLPKESGATYLAYVERTGKPRIDYSYIEHPSLRKLLIKERKVAGGEWLRFDYYEEGLKTPPKTKNALKLASIFRSIDNGKTYALVQSFSYFDGYTTVHDSSNVERRYFFGKGDEITKVETVLPESPNSPYKTETFKYDAENRLVFSSLKGRDDKEIEREEWKYDDCGNLIESSRTGEIGVDDVKTFRTTYRYDKKNRLIEECDPLGKKTHYLYGHQDGNLLGVLTLSGDEVFGRVMFSYDKEGRKVKTIIDDGKSRDFNNFDGAHLVSFSNIERFSAHGLPEVLHEGYIDLAKNEWVTMKKTFFTYSKEGFLLKKREENRLGEEIFSKELSYDTSLNVISEIDKSGTTKLFSSSLKRTISKDTERQDYFSQDGNLATMVLLKEGKEIEKISYVFDSNGLLSSHTDHLGNTTTYRYDSLKRLVEVTSPPLESRDGLPLEMKESFKYDEKNRQIEKVDPLGKVMRFRFSLFDELTESVFPDGKKESLTYLYQNLKESIQNQDGTSIECLYDPLGRIILEKKNDPSTSSSTEKHYSYQGSLLASERLSSGITFCHSYTASGALSETIAYPTKRKLSYNYDLLDQVVEKIESLDDVELSREEIVQKDERDEDKETETVFYSSQENSLGQKLLKKTILEKKGTWLVLTYDTASNLIDVERTLQNGMLLSHEHRYFSKSGKKTAEVIDVIVNGKKEASIENRFIYDQLGRLIATCEGYLSPDEKWTKTSWNDHQKIALVEFSDGTWLEFSYDKEGRQTRFTSSDKTIDYHFEYDENRNLIHYTDALHALEGFRSYTQDGQLKTETLMNGLALENRFDSLGRRTSLKIDRFGEVQSTFKGGHLHKITRFDSSSNPLYEHTYEEFDRRGLPIKEQLIFSLGEKRTTYAPSGRPKKISTLHFEEEAFFDEQGRIKEVVSIEEGQEERTQFFYDDNSHLAETTGAFQDSKRFDSMHREVASNQKILTYNSLHQPISPHLRYDLRGNLIEKITEDSTYSFSYDALNRMQEVRKNGELLHHYIYDPFHRRVIDQAGEGEAFLYDGNTEIGKVKDQDLVELRIFGLFFGPEENHCIAYELKGEVYLPLFDLLGSKRALISSKSGEVCDWTHYSPFGEQRESSCLSPWGYCNRRTDQLTGLIFFGRRELDPREHLFTSQDPIGFLDGQNRYSYLQGDPVNKRDLFGLMSSSGSLLDLQDAKKALLWLKKKCIKGLKSLTNYGSLGFDQTLHHLVGGGFLLLLGYYNTETEVGSYGLGEANDKVRVSFINGILTDYVSLTETLQGISHSHGGVNVHYVYRPTKGWAWDILRSFLVKFGYVSPEAKLLANEWKSMIQEMGGVDGSGKIIHYAHSIGAIETLRALSLLTEEEQRMITVYTFGSPSVKQENMHSSIQHFVSVRDGVSMLDIFAYIGACQGKVENVTFMGSFFGLPFVDHLFGSATYSDLWKAMGKTFVEWYGSCEGRLNL